MSQSILKKTSLGSGTDPFANGSDKGSSTPTYEVYIKIKKERESNHNSMNYKTEPHDRQLIN